MPLIHRQSSVFFDNSQLSGAIGHAFVTGTGGFIIVCVFLGITEAGNFPVAIKAVAAWFPQKEKVLAA